MEIRISFDEQGKFSIEKSDSMAILTAIGMLELAKKLMFDNNTNDAVINDEETEEEEQITLEDLEINE